MSEGDGRSRRKQKQETHREVTEDEGLEVGLLLAESFEVLDERRELGRGSEVVLRQGVLPFLLLVNVAVAVVLPLLDFGHVQLGLLEPDLAEVRLLGWDLQQTERDREGQRGAFDRATSHGQDKPGMSDSNPSLQPRS